MKVLAILGHPRTDSYGRALLDAYVEGALAAGAEVRRLHLAELRFEPNVLYPDILDQPDEPDIVRARELVRWADHLVLVYPGWWGVMPALLKGFLDRVFTPGFAFRFYPDGSGWTKLLKGKTADIVSTLDMPPWVFRLFYRQPGNHALKRSTLGFAGIETTRILNFGPVRESTARQRAEWLRRARRCGSRLSAGAATAPQRARKRIRAWLAAARLQFYPLPWLVYTTGAWIGAAAGGGAGGAVYWSGLGFLLLLQLATVLANEYFDYDTDRRNGRYGPFNGGSRVLVEQTLSHAHIRRGAWLALGGSLALLAAAVAASPSPALPLLVFGGAFVLLAVGYTVPPLKLTYRTAGELDVALTHSLGPLLWGHLLHGGSWIDPAPYLLSVPLAFAILPSILLAGVPDYRADRAAGKRTVAVRAGRPAAMKLALACTAATAGAVVLLLVAAPRGAASLHGAGALAILLYAVWLAYLLGHALARLKPRRSHDGLIAASLGLPALTAVVSLLSVLSPHSHTG